MKGLGPAIRQNADIVAVTYQTQERSIETISKEWADIFADKDSFGQLLKENTKDYGLLIIDQTEVSGLI